MSEFVRSEEQQLAKAPIEVTLGQKTYEIKPLTIGKASRWRQKLITTVQEISGTLRGEADTSGVVVQALGFALLQFPTKMAELIFEYAPELPRELIMGDGEEAATEEQMAVAFSRIMRVAFPFAPLLGLMTQVLATAANSPASVPSTRSPSPTGV